MRIYQAIEEHLTDQPWAAECAVCGEKVTTDTDVDKDGDIRITVVPCEKCLKAAREEARDG